MGKEGDLVVETEGNCFLCSSHILTGKPSINYEDGILTESARSSLRSLQCLSRYIKMDMSKVFDQNDSVPQFLLEKVQKSVLKASLCLDCTNLTETFSVLFGQLEKVKMEVMSVVSLIHDKLKRADQNLPRLNDHAAQGEGGVVGKREIAKALRLEAMQNCSRKLKKVRPQVKLQNLSTKRVGALRNKSSHVGIQNEFRTDQHSMPGDIPGLNINVDDVKTECGASIASESRPNVMDDDDDDREYFENDPMDYSADEKEYSALQAIDGNGVTNLEEGRFVEIPVKAQGTIVVTPSEPLTNLGTSKKYTTNKITGKLECCVCSKKFAAPWGAILHFNAVHLNIKYKCNLCKKEFKYKTSFNSHLKSAHQHVTFKCENYK